MTTKIGECIDQVITNLMERIAEAAIKQDLASIEPLTRAASELKEIKERVLQVGAKLSRLDPQVPKTVPSHETRGKRLRELKIPVTDGAIRQNLLTMTEALKRGQVTPYEEFMIEALPSGERFRTALLASGNKLQERGAINRFYRDAHVRGGDFVLLTEISPGEWTLRRYPNGGTEAK